MLAGVSKTLHLAVFGKEQELCDFCKLSVDEDTACHEQRLFTQRQYLSFLSLQSW